MVILKPTRLLLQFLWPRTYGGATGTAIASGLASGGFQNDYFCLLVTVRHGSSLPGRQLSAGFAKVVVSCVLLTQRYASSNGISYGSYEDRCFAAANPKLWNNLPAHLRQTLLILTLNNLSGCQRHVCSGADIVTHCDQPLNYAS